MEHAGQRGPPLSPAWNHQSQPKKNPSPLPNQLGGLRFSAALTRSRTRHKRTRPYRPQTNGKVERYQRTLAAEWAYSRPWVSNTERAGALQGFLDHYNYARPHTAIKGKPPASRLPIPVNNLTG